MAQIFGSNRTNNPDPVAVGLRVQQSLQGAPIPIGCGRVRAAPNLINYDGFVATPVKGGGKGGFAGASGKGNTGQYDYAVWGIVQLAEGGVKSINRIFNGNAIDFLVAPTAQELIDLNAMGVNTDELSTGNAYNIIFHPGNWTDGPDSAWTAAFPDQTPLAYPGQAYVIFPKLGLGSSPSFPSFNFDYTFNLSGDIPALGDDANPADWIAAFLSDPDWGVQGFSSDLIGDFDTARNYWRATGLLISVAMTAQTSAQAHLGSLMPSLNAEFRWRDGLLDIVPYGDLAVTGNGYTYTPDTTPIYDIGVDDYLPNQGSLGNAGESDQVKVAFSRADESQVANIWRIEYLDRANLYNPVPIEHANDAQIAASGIRRYSDKQQQHWFCLASAASVSVALQLHRAWTTLNTYQFTLGKQFVLLDVLDLVAITEPALGLQNQFVRIIEIQENADQSLTFTVEEVPLTASAPVYARQPSLGIARNTALAPGSINAPLIFELPGQLSHALEVQFAVSGQNPGAWGGCTVWISSDGENYSAIGPIDTPARMGVLTAALPAVATSPSGPTSDNTNTLAIDVSESAAEINSGTSADLANLATICLVDSEILAYQNASLTGPYAYSLTVLERGCYGTQASVVAHASGAPFVRLDENLFKWGYTNPLIGKTVYFKFTSFNIYGTNEESLADVAAHAYTFSGTPTPSGISIATATLTQVGLANTLAVTWDADPLAVSYVFDYSTDGGATYTAVAVPNVTSWQIPGLQVSTVYVRIAGVNAVDVQGPYLAPVEVTGPPLNYAAELGLSYNDLTSSAMQQALDDIANEEAQILANVNAALGAAQALAASITTAKGASTKTIVALKTALDDSIASITQSVTAVSTAQDSAAALISTLSASIDNHVSTINHTFVAQATRSDALASSLTELSVSVDGSVASINQSLETQAAADSALSAEVTTFKASVDDDVSTINTTLTAQADDIASNAAAISSLSSSTSASVASIDDEIATHATELSALSSDVTTLTAQANAATADDQISWVASAGPSGAFGAWELSVKASGHLSSSASLIVSANSDGTSSIFAVADQFAIGNPATNTVPFQVASDGSLILNGVSYVNGSFLSAVKTGGGDPVLEIDFINGPMYFRA